MKRSSRIRLHVVLVLLLSMVSSQAMSMGYPHQLFSGKRVWKKQTQDTHLPKKGVVKVEGLNRSGWVSSAAEVSDESDSSVAQSVVRFVSDWLGNLLRPRCTAVAVRVGIPVELLKQTRRLATKADVLRAPVRLNRLDALSVSNRS